MYFLDLTFEIQNRASLIFAIPEKVASERGFEIPDNQGEGNCMFLAISEQLELIQGVRVSHKKKVVRYLKENPTLVSSVLAQHNF